MEIYVSHVHCKSVPSFVFLGGICSPHPPWSLAMVGSSISTSASKVSGSVQDGLDGITDARRRKRNKTEEEITQKKEISHLIFS
eukprot:Gb_29219 [translate_table: standard]